MIRRPTACSGPFAREYGALSGSIVAGFRPEFWAKPDPGGVPAKLTGFDRDLVGIDGTARAGIRAVDQA